MALLRRAYDNRVATLIRLGALPGDARRQAEGEYRYGDLGGWPRFWRKLRGRPVNGR